MSKCWQDNRNLSKYIILFAITFIKKIMFNEVIIHPLAGQIISILLMAVTILIGTECILKIKPLPWWQALIIATVSNLLGKLFVSVLHWPAYLSYTLPTVAYFILSYYFFKPSFKQMILYWITGFASYLLIHIIITLFFGWTFMFPFWDIRKYFA